MEVATWDYAAGALIVQEAGGVVMTVDGEPLGLVPGKTSILAGGKRAAQELVHVLED